MTLPTTLDAVELFIAFVFPGLVSVQVYRLLMPTRRMEVQDSVLKGLFFGVINLVLLLPLVGWYERAADRPFLHWLAAVVFLLLAPAVWPVLLRWLFRWKRFAEAVRIPYPSVWDNLFDEAEPMFVLVHLQNGDVIGGYFGGGSIAGSFPNDGELYLEAVYSLDDDGRFVEPVLDTSGLFLRREDYRHLEFFRSPEVTTDA